MNPMRHSRFVFKIKMTADKVDRCKSRHVVNGSLQVSGVDNTDRFAPVVEQATLRIYHAMYVHQEIDVQSAYMYADLHLY